MQFFGQVDHLKVQPKGPDHVDRIVEAQRIKNRIDLALVGATRIGAAAARQRAQLLDVFEGARAGARAQHVADEPAQRRNPRA